LPGRRRLAALFAAALVACGGGGGGSEADNTPVGPAAVTIAWNASRESNVNRPGGGYEVAISGMEPIDVPYVSGTAAPTSTTVTLPSGSFSITVRAYAAFDAQGGATRTYSSASQVLAVRLR
jgi:hypothetical protein